MFPLFFSLRSVGWHYLSYILEIFVTFSVHCSYVLSSSSMVKASSLTFSLKPLRESIDEVRRTKSESVFVLRADIDPVTIRTLSAPQWCHAGLFQLYTRKMNLAQCGCVYTTN